MDNNTCKCIVCGAMFTMITSSIYCGYHKDMCNACNPFNESYIRKPVQSFQISNYNQALIATTTASSGITTADLRGYNDYSPFG